MLLRALLPFGPAYEHPDLSKEKIWKQIYPNLPFSGSRLKTETKALFDLAKAFVAFLELEKRPQELALLSLSAFQRRGNQRLLRTESDALARHCAQQEADDDHVRFTRFRLAEIGNQSFGYTQKRVVDNSLQDMLNQLDRWYLVQKLRGACELLNRQNIFGTPAQLSLVNSILVAVATENFEDTPAIEVYQLVLDMLSDPLKRTAFESLLLRLEKHAHTFPQDEARALYKYAQNHCIAGINRGERQYLTGLLALYQYQLQTRIILENGMISHTDYTNISSVAVRLGKKNWADEFIENYKKHLAPVFQESVYRYTRALYHYHGEEFREAVRELSQIDFAESFYDLSARILLAKVYFESEEYESLIYHIEAFNRYLKRQKALSAQNRNPYLHFLRILKRLNRLMERWSILSPSEIEKRLQTVATQIAQAPELAHREWLEEQVVICSNLLQ